MQRRERCEHLLLPDRPRHIRLPGLGHRPSAATVTNLKIVTRDSSANGPRRPYELINYFHVYIINPSKPGETVNLTAAQDFVSFLTSPAFQSQLKTYLPTTDPADRRSWRMPRPT